ncbi:general substrate transporter [Martensiomyces pterosporus]|nr:general substrate transporter [Martensiomyces pterosporus]
MRYETPTYVVTAVTALGGLLFGYDIGIMSSILQMERFNEHFNTPGPIATGIIVSSLTIGCFLGSLLSGPLADRFSRKITIVLGALVCTIGSGIQFGSVNRAMLIVGRFVNGLSIGFLSSVVPMYQSETSPPSNRGRMVSLQQWAITWGIFIAFGIDYGCSYIQSDKQFRLPLGMQIVPSIILLFTMSFMPYSPRWLVAHNHISDARQVLGRLRAYGHASVPEVAEELRLIHGTIKYEKEHKSSTYWELLKFPNRRRTLLGCGIQFMQQFTGINTLMLYAPTIFRDMGLGSVQSIAMCQAINGLVNVSSTIPAIIWIDRWGRRPTLLIGTVLISVFYLVLALLMRSYSALTNHATHDTLIINMNARSLGIASISMVYLVVASFAFSWGPCGWLIPSEIFPTHLRAKANSVTTGTNWISNFVVTLTSPLLLQVAGWKLFVALSVIMGMNFVVIYLFLPETKNLTLEEMDVVFLSSVWAFRPHKKKTDRRLSLDTMTSVVFGDKRPAIVEQA